MRLIVGMVIGYNFAQGRFRVRVRAREHWRVQNPKKGAFSRQLRVSLHTIPVGPSAPKPMVWDRYWGAYGYSECGDALDARCFSYLTACTITVDNGNQNEVILHKKAKRGEARGTIRFCYV